MRYHVRVLGCDDHLPCLESTLPFELLVRSRKEQFRCEILWAQVDVESMQSCGVA